MCTVDMDILYLMLSPKYQIYLENVCSCTFFLETTECEPLHGYGFRRGGYQCRCRPGYRLPNVVRRPYLGEIVERSSTSQERKKKCLFGELM